MKKTLFVIALVVVVFLSACNNNKIPSLAKVSYGTLPSDSDFVGMATTNEMVGNAVVDGEIYSWSLAEALWPDKDCVTVGSRVESITFYSKINYKWNDEGQDTYCLVKK